VARKIMEIRVFRYSTSKECTLGLLFIDGVFECYTLEDEFRYEKVPGKTRIPAGKYKIDLRKEGRIHNNYLRRFPDLHIGMLHVTNVPNFEFILIHCGNDSEDTSGCLLVGNEVNNNNENKGYIRNSTIAYKSFYTKVIEAIIKEESVWIEYYDEMPGKIEKKNIKAKVKADLLNIREEIDKKRLGVLLKGTELNVIEKKNNCARVELKGWVIEEYLQ
jgi:hypothetical protein